MDLRQLYGGKESYAIVQYLDKSVTTIGFAASKMDAISSKLYQCLQGGIMDAACTLSHRILFHFLPFNAHYPVAFSHLLLFPFRLSAFSMVICSSILHLIVWWAEKHRAWDLHVSVWNHLQIQWIVPLASETTVASGAGLACQLTPVDQKPLH
jgi:hypothetical protein